MTSISIVRGEYKTEPRIAPFVMLYDSFGECVLEFHDRTFCQQACEHNWELRQFHTMLREQAVSAGWLLAIGDGKFARSTKFDTEER